MNQIHCCRMESVDEWLLTEDLLSIFWFLVIISFPVYLLFIRRTAKIRKNSSPLSSESMGLLKPIQPIPIFFLKMGHSRPLFLYFSSFQYTVDKMFNINKLLPMTGFEPRISGIGSDRSTNWVTTTSHPFQIVTFWRKIVEDTIHAFSEG